jgi:hypothetical protein
MAQLREFRKTKWYGGLSDSLYIPTENTFEKCYNIDIFSNPGVAQIAPLMKKDSGDSGATQVTELCNFGFLASDGNTYWFSTAGNVYMRTALGVWSKVYAGAASAILGACEYNGFIYWATATNLNRKPFPGLANWTDTVVGWKTLTTSTWHPMCVQSIYLVIGNATTLATVDDIGTFTASGTADVTLDDLKEQNNISCLIPYGEDVLAGTQYILDTTPTPDVPQTGYLCRWDLVSAAFTSITEVPDNGVYALGVFDNVAVAFCGLSGAIYSFDGTNVQKIKRVPTIYNATPTPSIYYYVNPGSVTTFKGKLLFAGVPSSGFESAVYELGRVGYGYPLALSQTYAPNNLLTHTFGAVVSIGNTFLVSTKISPTNDYGVWVMSTTKVATQGGLYFVVQGDIERNKTFLEYSVGYTGDTTFSGSIEAYAYPNLYGAVQNLAGSSQVEGYKYYYQKKIVGRTMMFNLLLVFGADIDVGTTLSIDSFYCKWEEEERL